MKYASYACYFNSLSELSKTPLASVHWWCVRACTFAAEHKLITSTNRNRQPAILLSRTPFFSTTSVSVRDAWDALIIPMGMYLRRVAIPVSLRDADRRLLGTAVGFVKCDQRGKCGRQAFHVYGYILLRQSA